MIPLCTCHNYVDEPLYRGPYDIFFGNEKESNEDFDQARHCACQIEGIDSFLYLEQDEKIRDEIIIKKSYSKFWKEDIYTFLDNILENSEKNENVLFLYYNNRRCEIIYKIKIYDIEKFEIKYCKTNSMLLDFELKISNFKQSYKFIKQKNNGIHTKRKT